MRNNSIIKVLVITLLVFIPLVVVRGIQAARPERCYDLLGPDSKICYDNDLKIWTNYINGIANLQVDQWGDIYSINPGDGTTGVFFSTGFQFYDALDPVKAGILYQDYDEEGKNGQLVFRADASGRGGNNYAAQLRSGELSLFSADFAGIGGPFISFQGTNAPYRVTNIGFGLGSGNSWENRGFLKYIEDESSFILGKKLTQAEGEKSFLKISDGLLDMSGMTGGVDLLSKSGETIKLGIASDNNWIEVRGSDGQFTVYNDNYQLFTAEDDGGGSGRASVLGNKHDIVVELKSIGDAGGITLYQNNGAMGAKTTIRNDGLGGLVTEIQSDQELKFYEGTNNILNLSNGLLDLSGMTVNPVGESWEYPTVDLKIKGGSIFLGTYEDGEYWPELGVNDGVNTSIMGVGYFKFYDSEVGIDNSIFVDKDLGQYRFYTINNGWDNPTLLLEPSKLSLQATGIGTIFKVSDGGVVVTIRDSEPSCEEGAIYYSSSVKHFYGCVGSIWKQLDN